MGESLWPSSDMLWLILGDDDIVQVDNGVFVFGPDVLYVDQDLGNTGVGDRAGGYVGHGEGLVIENGTAVDWRTRIYNKLEMVEDAGKAADSDEGVQVNGCARGGVVLEALGSPCVAEVGGRVILPVVNVEVYFEDSSPEVEGEGNF